MGHFKYRSILIVYLFLIGSCSVLSQDKLSISKINLLELNDGLKNRIVYEIVRDNDLNYWLNMPNGLQIFDGRNFGKFIPFHEPDYIRKVTSDSTGIFCITNDNKLIYYKTIHDTPDTTQVDEKYGKTISFSDNIDAYNYFQTNKRDSIFFYKNLHKPVLIAAFDWHKPISSWIYFNHSIYFISENELYKYDKKLEKISKDEAIEPDINFRSKLYLFDDKIYFSFSRKRGVYSVDKQDNLSIVFPKLNIVFSNKDKVGNLCFGLTDKYYLITTELKILNQKSNQWTNIDQLLKQNKYLTSFVSEDFTANLITSSFNGIYSVTFSNNAISTILNNPNIARSQFGPVIGDFESVNEKLYFLREGGGVWVYDSDQNLKELINKFPLNYGLRNLNYDSKKNIFWCLTFSSDQSGNLVKFKGDQILSYKKIPFNSRKIILLNDQELMVFGNLDETGIITRYSIEKDSFIIDSKFENNILYDVFIKNKNEYWIAGSNGLTIYNPIEGNQRKINECVNASLIQSIGEYVFVHTRGYGCFVFKDDKIVKHLTPECCLSNESTTGTLLDKDGNYWIGTYNGINILNQDFEPLSILYEEDGLSANECNTGAMRSDGRFLFFGTINGITKINPKLYFENLNYNIDYRTKLTYSNKEVISTLDTKDGVYNIVGKPNYVEIDIATGNKLLENNFSKIFDLQVEHEIDNIQFINNKITLTKPNTGENTISLISHATGQILPIAKISIQPDYSNTIKIGIISTLVLLLSFLISNYIINRNKHQSEEKTKLIKRINDVELEALRSQMNPHFIFNSLVAIQYYILKNEKSLAAKYLTKFAKLMRMFLESSKSKTLSLKQEKEQLGLYLELEQLRFSDNFEYNISIDPNINIDQDKIPSMLLQPIIENAILHGINHMSEGRGKIDITFKKKINQYIECIIDDNGIGREKSMAINKEKRIKHKSRATQMINERIELLQNLKEQNIDIEYVDKKDDRGNPSGTKVIIRFYES